MPMHTRTHLPIAREDDAVVPLTHCHYAVVVSLKHKLGVAANDAQPAGESSDHAVGDEARPLVESQRRCRCWQWSYRYGRWA